MSRDNFISDHLVDMRFHHQEHEENAEPEAAPAPKTPDAEKYLPTIRRTAENGDSDRERRDLEGRIIHDLAALDREREFLQTKLAELEKFSGVLTDARSRLEHEDVRRIAPEYFAAHGRWSAFDRPDAAPAAPESFRAEGRGAYWVAGAVLAGSVIVALALIAVFH